MLTALEMIRITLREFRTAKPNDFANIAWWQALRYIWSYCQDAADDDHDAASEAITLLLLAMMRLAARAVDDYSYAAGVLAEDWVTDFELHLPISRSDEHAMSTVWSYVAPEH